MNSSDSLKKSSNFDISFVGLTHLGLVASICTAAFKLKVLAIDEGKKIISSLSKKILSLTEPGLANLLSKHSKFYYPSTDFQLLSKSQLAIISLDTPTDKPFSLRELRLLINKTLQFLANGSTLVIMSQVPVGFCKRLSQKIKKSGKKIELYYFLNTLIIGDSVNRFLKPERIIIGREQSISKINPELKKFLSKFDCPILEMSYESAELTKSAINLYLASSIITTNSLADFCENLGANIYEIIPALTSDKRIGPYAYLKPTLRISGGHLERELSKLKSLATKYHISTGIVEPLIKLNNERLNWLYSKIRELNKKNNIQTITLWGLSYKNGTESTANAASIEIIRKLRAKFKFQVYDPQAIMPKNMSGYKRFNDKYSALKNADLLIILTGWDEFKNAGFEKIRDLLKKGRVIDCVEILSNNYSAVRMGNLQ